MFPFMAQGHIIPFLALALQIEQRKNYTITFVNTPLNIKNLRSTLPANSSIHLLETLSLALITACLQTLRTPTSFPTIYSSTSSKPLLLSNHHSRNLLKTSLNKATLHFALLLTYSLDGLQALLKSSTFSMQSLLLVVRMDWHVIILSG